MYTYIYSKRMFYARKYLTQKKALIKRHRGKKIHKAHRKKKKPMKGQIKSYPISNYLNLHGLKLQ